MTTLTNPTRAPRPSLDEVIEQYAAEGPSYDTLNEWVRRYPEYRAELADFTVRWSAFERTEHEDVTEDDPYVSLGIGIVQDILAESAPSDEPEAKDEETTAPPAPEPVATTPDGDASGVPALSLEAILEECGTDLFELEDRSGLDYSVLVNLASGGFTFETPELRNRTMRKLARHVCAPDVPDSRLIGRLDQSVCRPPYVTVGAAKSKGKPEARTKDFFDGVRDAKGMTPEAKAEWLALRDEEDHPAT
jgi:hypothetical protein